MSGSQELHAACTDRLHAQSGVAILIRRGLAIDIVDKGTDPQGRVAWILADIYSKKLLIIGVYGPSSGDDDVFLQDRVFSILDTVQYDHVVLGGDWNVGMDEDLDYWNYASGEPKRPKSRRELHSNIQKYNLIDIYRELHPEGTEKTWRLWNRAGKKADKEARLDYFLVDTDLASFVELVGVAHHFTSQCDHRPVIMNIDYGKVKRGPGYWKFNNLLLEDLDFTSKVRNLVVTILYEYQRTDLSVRLTLDQISTLTFKDLATVPLSITHHTFLEFLLFSIKNLARKHGSERKGKIMNNKSRLEENLRVAAAKETQILAKMMGPLTAVAQGNLEEELLLVKEELSKLESGIDVVNAQLNEGAYVRCGFSWKCPSEQSSKVFFAMEKWRGAQRHLGIVEVDSEDPRSPPKVLLHQPEIETEIQKFYKELYRARPTECTDQSLREFMSASGYDEFKNSVKRNSTSYDFEKLKSDISAAEVLHAINNGKHGVAPGISGFSREFYKHFQKELIPFIMCYIEETEKLGILSQNQRVGVITLLPKGDKDKTKIKNWRPITLLPTLYKIISGVIANRIKNVLPNIISTDQCGFVDGRYMGEVTRTLYDAVYDAFRSKKQ